MIDIETMGRGENAVMIQLAGVFFNRETGETGKEFCKSLSVESCKDFGFVTHDEAVKWWSEQNQDVLKAIIAESENALDVMDAFVDFLGSDIKNLLIWSHATFDFPIVQAYLQKITKSYMPYRGARDIRTLVDLSGIDLNSYDWNKKTHNALDDCKFQIQYCVDAMRMLKNA
jgi:exodeoxyribonuclease VIII